jgi:PAS domain S-box-containing protein
VESEEVVRAILAHAPIACHEINQLGEVVFVNETECGLLGLPAARILSRPIWEFVAPEERDPAQEAVRRKLAGEKRLSRFEQEYIRPDGTRLVLEIYETHIRDENSRVIGIRSFLIDMTQRKRTEQALQESEKLYRHLVEYASDIIYRTDIHGRFTMFNPVAPRLLGFPAEELVGRVYLDLIRPDFRPAARRFYRQQLARKLSHTYFEFPVIAKDGREIWFGQNVEIIEDEGRVAGFQAITRDITVRRRSEEVLRSAREELEQRVKERTAELEAANERLRQEMIERQREEQERRKLEAQIQHKQRLESLGVLAGGIAHDFNNLLAVIMGHASLALIDLPEHSNVRESLEEVVSASKSAAQLTEQMLAYSGRGKFTIEPIDLSQLIEDVTRLASALLSKKAALRLNLARELPIVQGDPSQLRQVVINLLTNASDALEGGSGDIQVTTGTQQVREGELPSVLRDRGLPGGNYVFLEVADTGCGMEQSTIARIFEPFFTTKFTGRGLGLAAVQGIVRGHDGTLLVESEPGSGSKFRVLLPAGETATARKSAVALDKADEDDWEADIVVLVADDEPAVRAVARRILERCRVTVLTAVDGYDAVRQFEARSGEISAVLLDLTMPGLDGAEVFQRLMKINPAVKVILSSGYDVHDVSLQCGSLKPAGFLRKPYSPAELRKVFRTAFSVG